MNNWYMLTLVGEDRPGIVAAVTRDLFDAGLNLGEAEMLRLGASFTIMMMVSGADNKSEIRRALASTTEELGLCLHIDPVKGGLHHHMVPNVQVTVSGADRAGMVARVAGHLAESDFNILDLESDVAGNPDQPVYIMHISGTTILSVGDLDASFEDLKSEGLDIRVSDIDTLIG